MKPLGIRVKGTGTNIYYQISSQVTNQEEAKAKSGNRHNQLFSD
ncbi:hypothetical protein [Candidatus Scalindua japonica]|nr:hypothetical protein [Candidatus Scalindua japonica]